MWLAVSDFSWKRKSLAIEILIKLASKERCIWIFFAFSAIEELRIAIEPLFTELNRLTELQEAITKQIRDAQQERDRMRAIEREYFNALREENPEV